MKTDLNVVGLCNSITGMTELTIDLQTLFTYVQNAVMDITDEEQITVFQNLAYDLNTRHSIPSSELREALKEFDVPFEDNCAFCDKEVEYGRQFCSYACEVNDCGCKGSPDCCGEDSA